MTLHNLSPAPPPHPLNGIIVAVSAALIAMVIITGPGSQAGSRHAAPILPTHQQGQAR